MTGQGTDGDVLTCRRTLNFQRSQAKDLSTIYIILYAYILYTTGVIHNMCGNELNGGGLCSPRAFLFGKSNTKYKNLKQHKEIK